MSRQYPVILNEFNKYDNIYKKNLCQKHLECNVHFVKYSRKKSKAMWSIIKDNIAIFQNVKVVLYHIMYVSDKSELARQFNGYFLLLPQELIQTSGRAQSTPIAWYNNKITVHLLSDNHSLIKDYISWRIGEL